MQMAFSMFVGVVLGIVLLSLTRNRAVAAVWTALVLGAIADVLFVAFMAGPFIPQLGRFGIIGVGLLAGVAALLSVGLVLRGDRKALNWVALVVGIPPVLFMLVFGIAEIVGPRH